MNIVLNEKELNIPISIKNLDEVEKYTYSLLNLFSLNHITVKWNNHVSRTIGKAKYKTNTLELNTIWFRTNLNNIKFINDVIRHEIAHFLAGSGHGHDAYWKSICDKIGCSNKRCQPHGITPVELINKKRKRFKKIYIYRCPNCGKEWEKRKKLSENRKYSCPICANGFNENFLINLHKIVEL